jgi:tetratricopeptide (TPR) repeat protein
MKPNVDALLTPESADNDQAVVQTTFDRGLALHQKGKLAQAQAVYQQVLAMQPRHFDALHLLGITAYQTKKLRQAVAFFDKALEINPRHAFAHNSKGVALRSLQQPEAALESYDQAVHYKPDYADAHNNRGNALRDLNQHQAAIASYDKAIALKTGYAEAYNNRAAALVEVQQLEAALESFDKAIALKADHACAHFDRGMCLLQMGQFELGWKEYEWRWKDKLQPFARNFTQPLWLGAESLQGKTILLHSEQGFGDTIQFCRYAKLVNDLGARVILEIQEPLMGLLTNLEGVAQLVARGSALPAFDYHCPLLSLPLAFKTNFDTIPAANSYLAAHPGKVMKWQAKLGSKAKPRIGLVWSGSATQKNDHNRSFLLSGLVKFLRNDFQYISLQKETRVADKETLNRLTDILHFGEELKDFTDTAALCELVDVVISVDTSVAHLAGALGKPVWIVLPFNPGWRWLRDRNDSPWYASAKLYRQKSIGDWAGVFERVRADLSQLVA